jgi:hypothetical protein
MMRNVSNCSVDDIWLTKTKTHNGKPSEQSKTEIVGLSLGQRFSQIRGSLLVVKSSTRKYQPATNFSLVDLRLTEDMSLSIGDREIVGIP